MTISNLTESLCISHIQNYHSKFIVDKVIRALKRQKKLLLSGEESGLKNLWEEYCVQLQQERSYHFETYIETLKNFIDDEISKQPQEIQKVLDFSENENFDKEDEFENNEFHYSRDNAIDEILKEINTISLNFENKNIRKYLDNY